jgi:histidinol dehydrogenase
MRCELVAATEPARTAAALRGLIPAADDVSAAVAEIIARVRAGGDEALEEFTRAFDTPGGEPPALIAGDDELEAAAASLEAELTQGLELAITNVRRVAEAALRPDPMVDLGHQTVSIHEVPVERAAVYVPGGRAAYPSTVVMGVVSARVAGVREVVVCSPPGRSQTTVLAACRLCGADTVYRMGGAQAIAALAYGTGTVAPVDLIAGPGNLYVQEAKRQVAGDVGIDGFAGPSDLVVVAGEDADPEQVALDLLAQAEHGPGTLVVGISSSRRLLERVQDVLRAVPDTGAVARLVTAEGVEHALELARRLAPEHLQLVGTEVEPLAHRISTAGALFVGSSSGTAFGDYIAGSNHILPTAGSARFASALSAATFRRLFYEVRVRDPAPLARAAVPVARAEGFEIHARSMAARSRQNPES